MGQVRHVECMNEMRNVYRILVSKPEGKIPLQRTGHRWKHTVKMGLKGV
jgi:hypothetical protein